MAGLKKPSNCKCGSLKLHREYHPERWVCDDCKNIVISRGRKPTTGICRDCGKSKEEVPFHKHGNICRECRSAYNKQYGIENRDKILEQKRQYYKENRESIRAKSNKYWQSSWETYLSDRFSSTAKTAKKRIGSDKLRNLTFEITREDLYQLIKEQDFKCAITKIPLVHEWGKLESASIDRIDSNRGYVVDNIQLVCKGINLMKSTHSNEEALDFLRKINV